MKLINKDIDLEQIHKCLGHLHFAKDCFLIKIQREEAIESINRSIELLFEIFPECRNKTKKES